MGDQYINNKQLYNDIVKYKELYAFAKSNNKRLPQIPDSIGKGILLICNNMARRGNYRNYTWLEEMISDAVLACIKAVDNFDPVKSGNPYGFFSRIAWNAFLGRIAREKRENYVKIKNYQNLNAHDPDIVTCNEFTDEVIYDFESTMETKKNKKKSLKRGI